MNLDNQNALQKMIDEKRAEIRTDEYSMSIGEWINLYENNEIDIHPEFQRFFRWSPEQKSKLIESILLGIPIPQIFVAQRLDGIWDVVDGLQRLSTIYQFIGILKDENNKLISPLVLEPTKYLPALAGKKWDDPDDSENSFTQAQRLHIKRSKIQVSIILKESDETSKYELFQRLNTGGSPLSDQEVRNCILVMINKDRYEWMRSLSKYESFKDCVSLTDRALEEQYDLELVLRFLVFRNIDNEELRRIGDLGQFLNEKMIELAESPQARIDEEEEAFKKTFDILRENTGSNSFRRYDTNSNRFLGGFLVSAYEIVSFGVGFNYKEILEQPIDIEEVIKHVWMNADFVRRSGSGVRASTRILSNVPLAREVFHP